MLRTTFNAKYASDFDKRLTSEDDDIESGPIGGNRIPNWQHLPEGIDSQHIENIILTNSQKDLEDNRFRINSRGEEDRTQPVGNYYVLRSYSQEEKNRIDSLKKDREKREQQAKLRGETLEPESFGTPWQPAYRGEIIPTPSKEDRASRLSPENLRRNTPKTDTALIQAYTTAANLIASMGGNSHEECHGKGMVDGKQCEGCNGYGNNVLDPTMPGEYADIAYSSGVWNRSAHNHNQFCSGSRCINGCLLKEIFDPIRQAHKDLGFSSAPDHMIKVQAGFDPAIKEDVARKSAYRAVKDKWKDTTAGLRAIAGKNNVQGAATGIIGEGDIVSWYGSDDRNPSVNNLPGSYLFDPNATVLIEGTNDDGTYRGFVDRKNKDRMQGEIEDRKERARQTNTNGVSALTLDLERGHERDGFSTVEYGTNYSIFPKKDCKTCDGKHEYTKEDGSPCDCRKEDISWKNDDRDSTADVVNRARAIGGGHRSIADRSPTDVVYLSSIDPTHVVKTNPTVRPHLAYMGQIYQTVKFRDIVDHLKSTLKKRTGDDYAESTLNSSERAVVQYRDSNTWDDEGLEKVYNVLPTGHKAIMHKLLLRLNKRNGVPSSSVNSSVPDFNHPLNLLPRSAAADIDPYYLTRDVDGGGKKTELAEQPSVSTQQKMINEGYHPLAMPAPPIAEAVFKSLPDEDVQSLIEGHIGGKIPEHKIGDAINAFRDTGDLHQAHLSINPDAGNTIDRPDIGDDDIPIWERE